MCHLTSFKKCDGSAVQNAPDSANGCRRSVRLRALDPEILLLIDEGHIVHRNLDPRLPRLPHQVMSRLADHIIVNGS